jgi:Flp pilus assembly protein TadD
MGSIGINRRLSIIAVLFLAVITAAAFWQVLDHEFINFDDDVYVTQNRHVQAGLTSKGAIWAVTNTEAGFWIPLTWLSLMLDGQFYGLNPCGYHLTNLLLHIANTLLLFLVLTRMTGALWRSAFVAALFALHPLHVESVAWVSERKDVLATLFWMLTMGLYIRYTACPGIGRYLLCLLFFALGLMAKPTLVTLPFVLLLLDFWPLGRFRASHARQQRKSTGLNHQSPPLVRLILEKAPFIALAGISCFLTFVAHQRLGAVAPPGSVPLQASIANALVCYAGYIGKMIWPHNMAVFYPHPVGVPVWQAAGAGLLLVCVSLVAVRAAQKRPYLIVGWLWYLGTLVPVIGLVQAGSQAMADRWTYVSLIGLFLIIAWGLDEVVARCRLPDILVVVFAGVLLSVLIACTRLQVQRWHNSTTLFEHTLNVAADNHLVRSNLGNALARQGRLDEAIVHFSEALRIKPHDAEIHNNIGNALAAKGNFDKAIAHFSEALRIKPDHAGMHYNLGRTLARQGRLDEAIAHFSEAVRINTEFAIAHNNLGIALARKGRLDEAIAHFSEALRIDPNFVVARRNMGTASQELGKPDNDARVLTN